MPTARTLSWALLPRSVGVAALAVLVVIFLGCMSLSIGERAISSSSGTVDGDVLCQQGKLKLGSNCAQVVYYPIPYASPPNLQFDEEDDMGDCVLEEQRADCFTVRRKTAGNALTVTWHARGVRRLPPPPVAQPPEPPAPPGPALPPRPVPIDEPPP
jgi:hypothetical protein